MIIKGRGQFQVTNKIINSESITLRIDDLRESAFWIEINITKEELEKFLDLIESRKILNEELKTQNDG